MSDPFIEHLNRASEIVSSWPEWKRNILGAPAMFPKDYFEAGHRIMVERQEEQRKEEARNKELWQHFRAGMAIGFLTGLGIGMCFMLILQVL